MDRYKVVKQLGDGTYGEVLKASNRQTGEVVAIKRMKRKYYSWDECMALQEVKSLRKMKHPNIVKLKEVIREQDILYFVFEFLEQNLYEVSKGRQKFFPENTVRNYIFQVLQGLGYMHKHGYFHRDIKPENILVSGDIAKVADFGLAKAVKARPPHTDYVSTRWYRAPEVLLRSPNYNAPIDIWAVGCMMAELVMLRPLFPGASESDELHRITAVLGTPTPETWQDGLRQAASINYRFPKLPPCPLQRLMPHASTEAVKVMQDMMLWDPKHRPTCAATIQYPFFPVGLDVPAPSASNGEQEQPTKADTSSTSLGASRSSNRDHDKSGMDLDIPSGPEVPSARQQPAVGALGVPAVSHKKDASGFGVADLPAVSGAAKGGANSINILRQARYVPGVNPLNNRGLDDDFGAAPPGGGARRPLAGGFGEPTGAGGGAGFGEVGAGVTRGGGQGGGGNAAVGMRGVAGLFANGGMGQAVGQQIQPKPMGRGLNFPPLGSNAPSAAGARVLGGGFGEPGVRGGALPVLGGGFGETPAPSGARKQQFDAFGRRRY